VWQRETLYWDSISFNYVLDQHNMNMILNSETFDEVDIV
jgi:hypothetical protein